MKKLVSKLLTRSDELNINIPAEMEEIFNHSGITQLIDQAYGILVKSFNDTQGKPLTYEKIQNRVEAFKSDRGIPPGITITEIISLLKQIKKSEKAGLIPGPPHEKIH